MNTTELNQVMTNISMMFDFEKVKRGTVVAPDGSLLVGGAFVHDISVSHIKDDLYLLEPNNKFWCYLSIIRRNKENPYLFTEVINFVHYSEFNENGFEREILNYNNNAGITTKFVDLVNFDENEFKTLI